MIDDNFASLELYYKSSPFNYSLTPIIPDFIRDAFPGKSLEEILSVPFFANIFPMLRLQEAITNPVVQLTQSQLRSLGPLRITEVELIKDTQTKYISNRLDEILTSQTSYAIYDRTKTMTFEQRRMEPSFLSMQELTP